MPAARVLARATIMARTSPSLIAGPIPPAWLRSSAALRSWSLTRAARSRSSAPTPVVSP